MHKPASELNTHVISRVPPNFYASYVHTGMVHNAANSICTSILLRHAMNFDLDFDFFAALCPDYYAEYMEETRG